MIVFNACDATNFSESLLRGNNNSVPLNDKIEQVELNIKNIQSTLTSLEKKLSNNYEQSEKTIKVTQNKLKNIQLRLTTLEENLNANSQEYYMKVVTEKLNIRIKPKFGDKTLIAKAYEGAYLRVIKKHNADWNFIEFVIDGFYYYGYASSNKQYAKVEYLDPITFSKVNKRGLIKYHWIYEVYQKMKEKNYTNLGVGINAPKTEYSQRLLGFLFNSFQKYGISIEPFRYYQSNELSSIEQLCSMKELDAFLNINIHSGNSDNSDNLNKLDELSGNLHVFLIEKNGRIIHHKLLSLKSIVINETI